jgi:hypothetical protein
MPGQPQPYPQGATIPAGTQQYPPAGGYTGPTPPATGGYTVGAPPGQATPLHVQGQGQQQTGGGFWSTLKEIFLPPSGTSPSPRAMFDKRQKDPTE